MLSAEDDTIAWRREGSRETLLQPFSA